MKNNLFKNKFRVKTSRLNGWDYSNCGYYFVTICTEKNRKMFFGEIKESEIFLNKIGNIANEYWLNIPEHFPFVKLDEFIIMPNHIHGIIIIDQVETQNIASPQENHGKIETQNIASLQNRFGPQSGNLSSIVRGYKVAVKKYCVINNIDFAWQPRFYDRIIRDGKELDNIRFYIKYNVSKWEGDRNNPKFFNL